MNKLMNNLIPNKRDVDINTSINSKTFLKKGQASFLNYLNLDYLASFFALEWFP